MVLGESRLLIGGAPTSAALTPPLPASPWQKAHFCAKIGAPCAIVPLPDGRPVPSASTCRSQAARSPCWSALPRFGPAASAGAAASARTSALSVDMAHLPVAVDRPARDPVEMLAW